MRISDWSSDVCSSDRWPWRWRYVLLAAVFGMSLTGWRAQQQLDVQWPESRFNEELWVQGRITSLPERSVDRYADAHDGTRTWRFSFVPQGADAKAVPQKIARKGTSLKPSQ